MSAPAGQPLVKGQNGPITATDVVVSVQLAAPADLSALLVGADGKVEVWDPRGDNRCVKTGLGIFTPSGGYGVALATPPGAIGVGIAAGSHFGGVGVGANRNFVGAGLVGC